MTTALIGTAGWSIPAAVKDRFAAPGSHLERFARVLPAAEINSTFYRPHQRATFERWAASTPAAFRFSAKLPRTISHQARLVGTEALLDDFFALAGGLGDKLGVVLLQLPPSLHFDPGIVSTFLAALRQRTAPGIGIACEPRHASWFGADAEACLAGHRVARVAADPPRCAGGDAPGGWPGLVYFRLHGSPHVYYDAYDDTRLTALATTIAAGDPAATWCIFDNTASGAAAADALRLQAMLDAPGANAAPAD